MSSSTWARALAAALLILVCGYLPVAAQVQLTPDSLSLNDFNATIGAGARALGMGGAFVAVADDGSAASWNPAGLGVLVESELLVAVVGVDDGSSDYPGYTFSEVGDPASGGDFTGFATKRDGNFLDYFSYVHLFEAEKRNWVTAFSYQRAINRGFDLTQRTPSALVALNDIRLIQRTLVGQTTNSSGGYDVVAAAMGVNVTEQLSLGISLNYWDLDVEQTETTQLEQAFDLGGIVERNTVTFRRFVDQSGSALNANLGLMWRPYPGLSVGAVYKTAFDLDLDLTDVIDTTDLPRTGVVGTAATIEWPETYALGVSWRPKNVSRLLLSADWTQSKWSDSKLRRNDQAPELFPGGTGVSAQEDSRQIRFGGEFKFKGDLFDIPMRFGVFEDRQILQDDRGDPIDVIGYTAGVGAVFRGKRQWRLDLALVITESEGFRIDELQNQIVTPRGDGALKTKGTRVYFSVIYRFRGTT